MINIKPILWTENTPPNDECGYDHCSAETPFGRFRITWKGWKDFDCPTVDESPWDEWVGVFYTVEEAKVACQLEFENKILECINHENELLASQEYEAE
jgi:hypothetical protein